MNENWSTMNMDAFYPRGKSKDEVSMNDINNLLKGRSYTQEPLAYNQIQEHDPNDIRELEEYCQKRGILGVNWRKKPKSRAANAKSKNG
jgi:hypothetical protein